MVIVRGVTPEDVFGFVLDPSPYTKADTRIVWVTKLAETDDGMVAREDGTFLGQKFLRGFEQEVREIKRPTEAGERGKGPR